MRLLFLFPLIISYLNLQFLAGKISMGAQVNNLLVECHLSV